MDDRENESQVFVVRFWSQAGAAGGWRGQVEHVASGKRSPVRDFAELQTFIQGRLENGVHASDEG